MTAGRRLVATAVAMVALTAGACSSGGSETTDDEPPEARATNQDLRVAVGEDPFMAGNPAANDIGIRTNGPNPGIFDTFTRLGPTMSVEAALALRWESPSPKVWKFFLRRNVTFHNGTPFNAEAARFTKTGDLILTPELGRELADAVGERNAAFMVHHGIVTCGPDVVTAVMAAVLLERAARTNIRAIAGGGPTTWSSDEEALSKREHCYPPQLLRQAWDYLARRVDAR